MSNINIGIVGFGTNSKIFFYAAKNTDGVTINSICSKNIITMILYKIIFRIKHIYTSFDKMVCSEELDLVYIASPNQLHYEHIIKCLNNNKNVLCEKPMCFSASETEKVINLAKSKNLFLHESMHVMHNAFIKILKKHLKDKLIGDIKYAKFHLFFNELDRIDVWSSSKYGGVVNDLINYPLSWAKVVFDEIIPKKMLCYKKLNSEGIIEALTAKCLYSNNAIFDFKICGTYNGYKTNENIIEIYGTKGHILIPNSRYIIDIFIFDENNNCIIKHNNQWFYKNYRQLDYELFKHSLLDIIKTFSDDKHHNSLISWNDSIDIAKVRNYAANAK